MKTKEDRIPICPLLSLGKLCSLRLVTKIEVGSGVLFSGQDASWEVHISYQRDSVKVSVLFLLMSSEKQWVMLNQLGPYHPFEKSGLSSRLLISSQLNPCHSRHLESKLVIGASLSVSLDKGKLLTQMTIWYTR